ncbi:MAG: hypothetical protein JWP52_981 [Rhizobacter sp.]|nr:hypothetical protein [Rhizobacter sp.]
MNAAVALSVHSSPSLAVGFVPPFVRDGRYAEHFGALASLATTVASTVAVLRRLVLHVDASLTPDERLALYRALWQAMNAAEPSVRQEAASLFDGRHAVLLSWCDTDWNHPMTRLRLARAHLPGLLIESAKWRGVADAPFVAALVASPRDAGARSSTLVERPELVLFGMQACLHDMRWASFTDAALADAWQQAIASVLERHPQTKPVVQRTLFSLAVAIGADLATSLLADCIRSGAHIELPGSMLQRWLEADAAQHDGSPLRLAPAFAHFWLSPGHFHDSGYRAAMQACLARPALRERMAELQRLLGEDGVSSVAPLDAGLAHALGTIQQLDQLYQASDLGRPITNAADSLLCSGLLDRSAVAALNLRMAQEAIGTANFHATSIAFGKARSAGCPVSAGFLERLLRAIDPLGWRTATAALGIGNDVALIGSPWQEEEPFWQALIRFGGPETSVMAAYHLAVLYTDGCLQPCGTQMRVAARQGHDLWQELADEPGYAAIAQHRLADTMMRLAKHVAADAGGNGSLWFPAMSPNADRVMIVFSCFYTRHAFADLQLLDGIDGHHLLFVQNPESDWYTGDSFDALCTLVETRVLPHYNPHKVTCYFGSMGGHGALKLALRYGFQAVVFNPQTDLDLWAAFRPNQRAVLQAPQRHVHVADWPLASFERSPVYYLVGSSPADREAFAVWLERVRSCRNGHFIIEKFDDAHHAGLMRRAVPRGELRQSLAGIARRLSELTSNDAIEQSHAEVPAQLVPRLWRQIDHTPRLKLEIVLRDGRLFVADSLHTGTLPSSPVPASLS